MTNSASEKFWNKMAKKYAKSKVKDTEGYEKTLADTRKYLNAHSVVLELGCGTGTSALKLADSVGELLATDVSTEMIVIANAKKLEQGATNVMFEQATLDDASFEKEAFDAVLAYNLIHLLEDPKAALKRIHALLKPGGIFVQKTACLRENGGFWPLVASVASKFLRIPYIQSFTADELKNDLTQEGFEVVEAYLCYPKPPRLFAVARKSK